MYVICHMQQQTKTYSYLQILLTRLEIAFSKSFLERFSLKKSW